MRFNTIQANIKRTLFLTFLFILSFQNIIANKQNNTELLDSLIAKAQYISPNYMYDANEILNKAFRILSLNNQQKENLDYYLKIGKEFSVLNNENRALTILINGLELSAQYTDSIKMWEFTEAIGVLYHKKADYTTSLNHFVMSLNIAENIKDTLKVAQSCDRISTILKEQKEYSKALEYLNKSLKLKTQINDKEGKLSTLITIADINTLLKNLNRAIELYKLSERMAHELSNKKQLSRIYSNMGNCYFYLKNYSEAENLYLKGINIKKVLGDKYRLAIAYNNLSIFYKRISNFDAAYNSASISLDLSKEASATYIEMSCYLNLSHYFKLKKDFEKAYNFQRKYAHLKDSLFNAKKSKQLTEIREKYETEKKEQQIEILEIENKTQEALIKKNRIIRNTISVSGLLFLLLFIVSLHAYTQKQKTNQILSDKNIKINEQNIELEKLNKTKNKFFSIIAHDLRSPLGSIEGVSELISKLLEQNKKDEIIKLSKHIDQSVSNVNTLLDNLLNWSLSQIKRLHVQFEKLDINDVINHSIKIQSAIAESKDIKLKTSVVEGLYVFADLNLLRVILRNLLSNAIKFSPSGKQVEINAIRVGKMIQINIIDLGVGMNTKTLKHLFDIKLEKSKEGTKGEKGSGLGLILCKEFIEVNKGEIKIESKLQTGTKVSFTLPSYI